MSVKCELSHTTFVKQEWKKPVDRVKEYICKEVQTENGGYLEIEKELIKCKGCYFYGTFQRKHYCTKYDHTVKQDGFCAWAEPKENHENI